MPLISRAEIAVFEKRVQLPMVLLILERDREWIRKSPFKLKAPYLELLDRAIERAKSDLAETIDLMRANGMKVRRGVKTTISRNMYFAMAVMKTIAVI